MHSDLPAKAAYYYELSPDHPDDLPFYREHWPSAKASVLELGCGTGRVLVPFAAHCAYIHGLDSSEAMLAICRQKLSQANIQASRARVELGDISGFKLGQNFGLIIAPYRVLQNLESDEQVDGLFDAVRQHLKPNGRCILNVFHPRFDRESMKRRWCNSTEEFLWELPVGNQVVKLFDKRASMDPHEMVLYPRLIWREYEGDTMVKETVLDISMRCYYPDEFKRLITEHGFQVVNLWGGYAGEPYGAGPELVIEFKDVSRG